MQQHALPALLLALAFIAPARPQAKPPEDWAAVPMPADRAEASYAIYSSLLPLGETASADWPHGLWLVGQTTITAVPPDAPCWVAPGRDRGFGINPHTGLHAPAANQQDLSEILEDFDKHCHERVTLQAEGFHVREPLRVLNEAEQRDFRESRFTVPPHAEAAARYKGAPALYSFSQVYFNAHHTAAAVYATHWCGGLCGQGFWVAFLWQDGRWQRQQWATSSWIS